MRRSNSIIKATCLLLLVGSSGAFAQSTDISSSFKNPPPAAWPRAWWHWTNSNVTKTGITKDMEWMKRVGIQGMQMGDVASGSGQAVPENEKIVFGTPQWLDALKHTAEEAQRLNLEFTMFTSAGWSLTGGPWVKPEQAMKKVVWSENRIDASKAAVGNIKLLQPPSAEGAGPLLQGSKGRGGFYKDYAVVAFKTPPAEIAEDGNHVTVTTAKGVVTDAATLFDQDVATGITVPAAGDKTTWIQLAYDKPFHARAITLAARGRGIAIGKIQVSNDGIAFKTVATTPGKLGYRPGVIRTYAFPDVTAKYFRLVFTNEAPQPGEIISEITTAPIGDYAMTEITLHSGARIDRWQEKAGFNQLFEYTNTDTPPESADAEIKKNDIIDLTSKMSADGTLNWTAPKGTNWTIMRFGYALTGAKNRPAVPAGSGYEADKMSVADITSYMDGYTAPLKKAMGPLYGKSLQYMVMDSWEAGITNWTELMPEEFQKRRGYSLLQYLPALAGYVVDDPKESERFLWDFRRTIVDLIAQNHYGTVTDYLHKDGIKTYSEAGGVSLESTEDALLNKKYVDIPMGEFWVKDLHPSSMYYEDMRGAASASHVYGKGLVAAESFTGGNYEAPAKLKNLADYWFTQGLNRMVFHTSAQQPLDTKPGNTMVGTHINRNITWAELGRPFMTYLARNMYMLQRGLYSADILYLLNEGAPSTMPFWGAGVQPSTPEGYLFDYINADALETRVSVDGKGKLVFPDGLQSSIIVLPPTPLMSLPVLRKLKELVQGGATVVGPKPTAAPGLTGGASSSDDELKEIVFDMWGDLDGISRTYKAYGKGSVYWGLPLDKVLKYNGVKEDVLDHRTLSEVSWIHRRDGDKDIYLVVNRTDSTQNLHVQFRVTGKEPILWHPDRGNSEEVSYQMNADNTEVPVSLEPHETVYVVFDKATQQKSKWVDHYTHKAVGKIDGAWQLTFPANWGAPTGVQQMDKLASWTENTNDGIKYFSGTATYTKTFDVTKDMLKTGKLSVDLGNVGDIAVVTINGGKPDTLWHAPYRTVSSELKSGKNTIKVEVTNEWTNRIAGDRAAPADKKILASAPTPFGGNAGNGGARGAGPRPGPALPASGLLGPVRIMAEVKTGDLDK